MMKVSLSMTILFSACCLLLMACNPIGEEIAANPEPTGKTILSTWDYYSLVPQSNSLAYKMEVTRYADGSVDVARTIVPVSSDDDYTNFVVEGATGMQKIGGSYQISFASDGWRIPFDPTQPPVAIAGGSTQIHCDCYGMGGCSVTGVHVFSNGAANFHCGGSCNEECIGRVTQSGVGPYVGGAVLLNATSVNQ